MSKFFLIGVLAGLPGPTAVRRQRSTVWKSRILEKGRKLSEWKYYGYSALGDCVVTRHYDHTTTKLLYSRLGNKLYETESPAGQRRERTVLTQLLFFVDGHETLAAYTTRLNSPAPVAARNVQDQVVIGFLIDTLSRADTYHVLRGVGSGCDGGARHVSRTVPHRVGIRVAPVFYELPFTLRLR